MPLDGRRGRPPIMASASRPYGRCVTGSGTGGVPPARPIRRTDASPAGISSDSSVHVAPQVGQSSSPSVGKADEMADDPNALPTAPVHRSPRPSSRDSASRGSLLVNVARSSGGAAASETPIMTAADNDRESCHDPGREPRRVHPRRRGLRGRRRSAGPARQQPAGTAAQCGGSTTVCCRSHRARRAGSERRRHASLIRLIVGVGAAPASGW